jgi:hypothetical protein
MINSIEQEDQKAERKKQEERARTASAARKETREKELKALHALATQVAALIGGAARPALEGNAWMFIDVGENHKLSFYRERDQIDIRGNVDGVRYSLILSQRLAPAEIAKAINRKSSQ